MRAATWLGGVPNIRKGDTVTVEEWLQRVKKADDRVEDLKFKRQIALNSLCGGAIDTGNERVQTSQTNATEDKMIAYADYAELINQAIDEYIDIRHEVETAINQVDCYVYRELLRLRYLEYRDWNYIGNKLMKNPNSVRHRIKKAALEAVKNNILYKFQENA